MELCEKLKLARKRMGHTQCMVSSSIGISNTALSNYETGYREPDLATLKQLAKFYGVSLDYLIDLEEVDVTPGHCDLWHVARGSEILFHGKVYPMSESRSRRLRRLLAEFFGVDTTADMDI